MHFAVVHHTAGSNNYTRAQSAAIVRGIEVYHVKGNGWNDIGYNFLVDKYGQVFEGRYGGVDKNVIGAHAEGFNTGSFGVALIGTYDAAQPAGGRADALVKLLAWRLDLAHVDPLSTAHLRSRAATRASGGVRRLPARDLRPPRHGLHRLPRGRAVRAAAARSRSDVAALGGCRRSTRRRRAGRRGARALHGAAVGRAAVDGHDRRLRGRRRSRTGSGTGDGRRLDVGRARRRRRLVHVDDRVAGGRASATGTIGSTAALGAPEGGSDAQRGRPRPRRRRSPTPLRRRRRSPRRSSVPTARHCYDAPHRAEGCRRTDARVHSPARVAQRPLHDRDRRHLRRAHRHSERPVRGLTTSSAGSRQRRLSATFTLSRAPLGVTLEVRRGTAVVVARPCPCLRSGQQTFAWPALKDGAYDVVLTVTDECRHAHTLGAARRRCDAAEGDSPLLQEPALSSRGGRNAHAHRGRPRPSGAS